MKSMFTSNGELLSVDEDLTNLSWLHQAKFKSQSRSRTSKVDDYFSTYLDFATTKNYKDRPPFSISSLIFLAIEDSPSKTQTVKGIYDWISRMFSFYVRSSTGWKNSVRHNLSLNRCFDKIEVSLKAPKKTTAWAVNSIYRHNLYSALSHVPEYFKIRFENLQVGIDGFPIDDNEFAEYLPEKRCRLSMPVADDESTLLAASALVSLKSSRATSSASSSAEASLNSSATSSLNTSANISTRPERYTPVVVADQRVPAWLDTAEPPPLSPSRCGSEFEVISRAAAALMSLANHRRPLKTLANQRRRLSSGGSVTHTDIIKHNDVVAANSDKPIRSSS